MRVVVTGSHGLIGSAVVARLRAEGHQVVRLVRSRPGQGEAGWDPVAGTVEPAAVDGADAVVHLAGAGLGDRRWSASFKETILRSRVDGTRAVARAVAAAPEPRPALVSGSAVGWYGSRRGDELLTEESGPGTGFLAEVVRQWEAATTEAAAAGARVVNLRMGVVLSAAGGALARQLPLFRLGVGGRLGSGRHWVSWLSRHDAVSAIVRLAATPVEGPVNVTAPNPVSNAGLTRSLARAMRRPAFVPVPAVALRLVLGREMAAETALADQRVLPARLSSLGFVFAHPDVDEAVKAALADDRLDSPA